MSVINKVLANSANIQVKTSTGILFSVRASNINAAVRYLQIHDTTVALVGGETPVLSVPIPAGSATVPASIQLDHTFFTLEGFSFTGLSIGISTAAGTFTAATVTDHVVNGIFE